MKQTVLYLFTGGLGVGKTSALRSILAQKPENETWGIVMNEFASSGIDQWLLPQKDTLPHVTVSGGCICCSEGISLVDTVTHLITTYQPTKIFIEPSGWAHPAELRDQLKQHTWTYPVALGPIFGLIDLVDWNEKRWLDHQSFWDMVHCSDVLLATKADLVETDVLDDWFDWVLELYPPKQAWDVLSEGSFTLSWLNGEQLLVQKEKAEDLGIPMIPSPKRKEGLKVQKQPAGWSASWLFGPEVRFDPQALDDFLISRTGVVRIKGIFQFPDQALVWQWIRGESRWEPVAYDRDSRLEVLAWEPLPWDEWDQELKACILIP